VTVIAQVFLDFIMISDILVTKIILALVLVILPPFLYYIVLLFSLLILICNFIHCLMLISSQMPVSTLHVGLVRRG